MGWLAFLIRFMEVLCELFFAFLFTILLLSVTFVLRRLLRFVFGFRLTHKL